MIRAQLVERGSDPMGQGHYGASRGHKKHKGIDYCASPGSGIMSNVFGTVTKLGYPYSQDLKFRYVEITTDDGYKHRFFYVFPAAKLGDVISKGDVIGFAQDIATKWGNGMKNHIHYEIMLPGKGRNYVDPAEYWS